MTPSGKSRLFRLSVRPVLVERLDLEMVGRRNYSREDVIRLLQRFDDLLGKGLTVEITCREIGVSAPTFHKWWQRW
jgi:transposase-like protein